MAFPRPVPLDTGRHDVTGFSSGRESLDAWLELYAGQNQRRDAARTFVILEPARRRVIGYYTLVASSLAIADATRDVARGLPQRFPIPVVLLARLAVDRAFQGRGLGAALLLDATGRIARTSDDIGVRAIVVDAIDDDAVRFYERFAFLSLTTNGRKLMVTVADARRQLGDT